MGGGGSGRGIGVHKFDFFCSFAYHKTCLPMQISFGGLGRAKMMKSVAVMLLLMMMVVHSCSGLYFHVENDRERCLLEELSTDNLVRGGGGGFVFFINFPRNLLQQFPSISVLSR